MQNDVTAQRFSSSVYPKNLTLYYCHLGGSAIALSLICLPFVTPALRKVCLPYVPATTAQVENVMTALLKNPQSRNLGKLIDIGSGDGRIVSVHFSNVFFN